MKIQHIIPMLLLTVLAPCASFAGETNAEMNAVIRAIHADFLKLKGTNDCFSNYSEDSLRESDGILSIYFTPPETTTAAGLQFRAPQSDHVSVCYININETNRFKYWNEFEDVAACRFPTLKLKIYWEVLIRDVYGNGEGLIRDGKDARIRELVKQIVETECAKEQAAIKAKK